MPNLTINNSAFNQISNKIASTASNATNYVKENPYKVAAALVATAIVAPLAFIAGRAAWNTQVICSGSADFCKYSELRGRASAAFDAASDAVKTVVGVASDAAQTVGSAAKSAATSASNAAKTVSAKVGAAATATAAGVGAAAQAVGGKVADVVAGKKPINNRSCLVFGSVNSNPLRTDNIKTTILFNNCARKGGLMGTAASFLTLVGEKASNAKLSVTNAAGTAKNAVVTTLSNAANVVSSSASSIKNLAAQKLFGNITCQLNTFNKTGHVDQSFLCERAGFKATWLSALFS